MINTKYKWLWNPVLIWICYIIKTDRKIFMSHLNRIKAGISTGAVRLKEAIMVVWKVHYLRLITLIINTFFVHGIILGAKRFDTI